MSTAYVLYLITIIRTGLALLFFGLLRNRNMQSLRIPNHGALWRSYVLLSFRAT